MGGNSVGSSHLKRELAGIALLLLGLFVAASLATTQGSNLRVTECLDARGATGPVGACLSSALLELLGLPATVVIPLLLGVHALRLFGRLGAATDRSWLLFLGGVILLPPPALALAREVRPGTLDPLAGLWGGFIAYYVAAAFGTAGA